MPTNQHWTWVVITDSNACKIFHYNKPEAQLCPLQTIMQPENKLKDIDLTSDKPGRYKARGAAHGTYSQQTDPKEVKIESFARDIAKELDHSRKKLAYKQLIMIASPHMHGLISKHLNKQVKELICHHIEKDLLHLKDKELFEYIQKDIQRSNAS